MSETPRRRRNLYVRNFHKYQHYQGRTRPRPPWTKLHKSFWDDPDLSRMSPATRLAALGFVTLAAESPSDEKNGSRRVEGDEKHWRRRLALNEQELSVAIEDLLRVGFLASSALAGRKRALGLEVEVEKKDLDLLNEKGNRPLAHDVRAILENAGLRHEKP